MVARIQTYHFQSYKLQLPTVIFNNHEALNSIIMRHGIILTNWVHWTVKSHKIIQSSLYQITDDGTVLVTYWRIQINKILWWGYYRLGLLFNSHFTTPFYSFTYEDAFYTTILNCIVCNPKFFISVLFCKKNRNFEFSGHSLRRISSKFKSAFLKSKSIIWSFGKKVASDSDC